MVAGARSLRRILTRQIPLKVVLYAALGRVLRITRPSEHRFAFERFYAQNPDPWGYRSRPYEQKKYDLTLTQILEQRKGTERALELGCSIGEFSNKLAPHFRELVAVDIAEEALN